MAARVCTPHPCGACLCVRACCPLSGPPLQTRPPRRLSLLSMLLRHHHHRHNGNDDHRSGAPPACRWLGRCITAHSFSHGLTRLVRAPGFPRCARRLLRACGGGGGGGRERQGETLQAAEGVGGSRQRDTRSHCSGTHPHWGTSARGVLRAAPHMTDPPPARFSSSFSSQRERARERRVRGMHLCVPRPSFFFREGRRRRGRTSTCTTNTTLPSLT